MKKTLVRIWFVVVLILTACGPQPPITPIVVRPTPAPLIESWPDMQPGWTRFIGASYPSILDAIYDPAGYLWARTSERVLRFDVKTGDLTFFSQADGLPGYLNSMLWFDDQLWVTGETTVAHYDDGRWESAELEANYLGMLSAAGGRVWLSADNGMYYFERGKWKEFEFPKDVPVHSRSVQVLQAGDGSLWFVSSYGTPLRVNGDDWESYSSLNNLQKAVSLPDGRLMFVFLDSIFVFDGEQFIPLTLPNGQFRYSFSSSLLTTDGGIWFQTYSDGKFQAYLIANGVIRAAPAVDFYQDAPAGANGWPVAITPVGWVISGLDRTLYLYDGKAWKGFSYADAYAGLGGVIGNTPIGFDGGGALWVLKDGLPASFDGENLESPYEGYEDYECRLYNNFTQVDADGNVFGVTTTYSTTFNLCFYEVGKAEPIRYRSYVSIVDFALAPDGNVWLALPGGYVAELTREQIRSNDIQGVDILAVGGEDSSVMPDPARIEVGPDGTVWVLFLNHGLYSYDGFEWTYHGLNQIENAFAFSIGPDGPVWVGMLGEMKHYDGQQWTSYPYECLTPWNMMTDRDGSVWFWNGSAGVYHFDGETWTSYSVENELKGLSSSTILSAPDGAIWFMGYSQWVRYQP